MSLFSQSIIFGASGFIGTHLASFLQDKGIKVYKADINVPSPNANAASSIFQKFQKIDVRKPIDIEGFNASENTAIFNLAAIHRTPGHPDNEYFETNIKGAENVCGFARKHDIKTIVFTSSISPYGTSEDLKTEETLPTPNTPYGISKLTAEHIHKEWAAESPERFLSIARPGIVFGKGENGNMTRLYKSLKKRQFAFAGRRDTIKACIYVKDLARILFEMAANPKDKVQTYNCTMHPAPTIETIARAMLKSTNLKRHIPFIPKTPLMAAAKIAGMLGGFGLGICPERVQKLMISTNISGEKLSTDYPLEFSLERAFSDWFDDCNGEGLE